MNDLKKGNLQEASMIPPNRLFTLDKSIAVREIGILNEDKVKEVEDALVKIVTK